MSIWKQCVAATKRLEARPEVFTEGDILTIAEAEAANRGEPWSEEQWRKGKAMASRIVRARYVDGRLVRFGPVRPPGGMPPDYARKGISPDRIGSYIVMAATRREGDQRVPVVPQWETPNGVFPALFQANDTIGGIGRRSGIDRDDSIPWEEHKRMQEAAASPVVARLYADLQAAQKRIEKLERENDGLRDKLNQVSATDYYELRR